RDIAYRQQVLDEHGVDMQVLTFTTPGVHVESAEPAVPMGGAHTGRFVALRKKADDLGAVIYIHPTDPAGVEAMMDYWLMPLVGFLMDTTLAASKLVFSGVVDRHSSIRWV